MLLAHPAPRGPVIAQLGPICKHAKVPQRLFCHIFIQLTSPSPSPKLRPARASTSASPWAWATAKSNSSGHVIAKSLVIIQLSVLHRRDVFELNTRSRRTAGDAKL